MDAAAYDALVLTPVASAIGEAALGAGALVAPVVAAGTVVAGVVAGAAYLYNKV